MSGQHLRQSFGVAAGLAGICLVVGVNALTGLGQQLFAQLALVLSAVSFGAAALFGRQFQRTRFNRAGSGIDDLRCDLARAGEHRRSIIPGRYRPPPIRYWALIGLAVFSTALAFVIYFRLIQTLGSVGATAQAYFRVPIGVALGVVFLGESLSSTALIGLICVIVGIAADDHSVAQGGYIEVSLAMLTSVSLDASLPSCFGLA